MPTFYGRKKRINQWWWIDDYCWWKIVYFSAKVIQAVPAPSPVKRKDSRRSAKTGHYLQMSFFPLIFASIFLPKVFSSFANYPANTFRIFWEYCWPFCPKVSFLSKHFSLLCVWPTHLGLFKFIQTQQILATRLEKQGKIWKVEIHELRHLLALMTSFEYNISQIHPFFQPKAGRNADFLWISKIPILKIWMISKYSWVILVKTLPGRTMLTHSQITWAGEPLGETGSRKKAKRGEQQKEKYLHLKKSKMRITKRKIPL